MQASGKTIGEVATITTTTTTTTTLTIITEAEDPTGVDTIPHQTEVATRSLGTTPQATAIRAMDKGEVAGKLGEAEVTS